MTSRVPAPLRRGLRRVLVTPRLARSPLRLYDLGLGGLLGRNLLRLEHRVRVTNGWGPPVPAVGRVLDAAEAERTFDRYRAVHPWRWAALQDTLADHIDRERPPHESLPVVDLELVQRP